MNIIQRIDEILDLKRQLVDRAKDLEQEEGVGICGLDKNLHIFQGIEKISEALGKDLDFSSDVLSDGRPYFEVRMKHEGSDIFQIGHRKNPEDSPDDIIFEKAKPTEEENDEDTEDT